MNRQEVAQVLVVFSSTWPRHEIPEATATVWADALKRFHPDHALEAARLVVEEESRFPAPGVFIAALQRVARRAVLERGERNALPLPARTPEQDAAGKAKIAELRKLLVRTEVDA